MDVRRIPGAATRDLRRRILRPDHASDALAARPGDDDPLTAHFGSFEGARLVAIATVMRESEPETPGAAHVWRIRGVATEEDARGRGHGAAVIRACIAHARAHGATLVWLNGRVSSADFYQKLGLEVSGEAFDTPPSGPHYRMRMRL